MRLGRAVKTWLMLVVMTSVTISEWQLAARGDPLPLHWIYSFPTVALLVALAAQVHHITRTDRDDTI